MTRIVFGSPEAAEIVKLNKMVETLVPQIEALFAKKSGLEYGLTLERLAYHRERLAYRQLHMQNTTALRDALIAYAVFVSEVAAAIHSSYDLTKAALDTIAKENRETQ